MSSKRCVAMSCWNFWPQRNQQAAEKSQNDALDVNEFRNLWHAIDARSITVVFEGSTKAQAPFFNFVYPEKQITRAESASRSY